MKLDAQKIAALGASLNLYAAAGVGLVGGIRSLVNIIHGAERSEEELNAILAAQAADAHKRANEREGVTD